MKKIFQHQNRNWETPFHGTCLSVKYSSTTIRGSFTENQSLQATWTNKSRDLNLLKKADMELLTQKSKRVVIEVKFLNFDFHDLNRVQKNVKIGR